MTGNHAQYPGKLLFIGHDASRTGAPLLLLHLIGWLKANTEFQVEILLKRGGTLLPQFRDAAKTRCIEEDRVRVAQENGTLVRRVARKLGFPLVRQTPLSEFYPVNEYPVVWANTIDSCDVAQSLADPGRRIIQHIHELEYCTAVFGATKNLVASRESTFAYVAASQAVSGFLIETIGAPAKRVRTIHEFPVSVRDLSSVRVDDETAKQRTRGQLQIPHDAFVVGMCGLPQWRKGVDLFVLLGKQISLLSQGKRCHFLWVGGSHRDYRQVLHDAKHLGIGELFHFVPEVESPQVYYSIMDVFALTSREDPFPVAMLEAALSCVPIVCFAGSGGAPELVEDNAGIVVPYLDIEAMARACVDLMDNPLLRSQFGQTASQKVATLYLLQQQGPKCQHLIEDAYRSLFGENLGNR